MGDWLFALHVFAAVLLAGSLTTLLIAAAGGRHIDRPAVALALDRIVAPGTIVLRVAMAASAILGVWLVLDRQGYALLDLWILAALALWFVMGALTGRSVVMQRKAAVLARELAARGEAGPSGDLAAVQRSRAASLVGVGAALATVVVLVLMIWKPGS